MLHPERTIGMTYSDVFAHHPMVFDEIRNRAYCEAMAAVIHPDSVVLDLGAGLGVLGLHAARMGARKVYCVEPAAVAGHIAELAAANDVADKVEVVRGRIEDVRLPERVDVVLSVFTGNLLFTEGLLPSLYFARDHWLKPGGTMIPDAARLRFAVVESEARYQETVGRFLHTSLGIDYGLLAPVVANGLFPLPRDGVAPKRLSDDLLAVELDMRSSNTRAVKWHAGSVAISGGLAHGLLGWIEIRLGGRWLTTAAEEAPLHWRPVFLPVSLPIAIRRDQPFEVSFQFVDDARIFWSLATGGVVRRQSTVMKNMDYAIDAVLASPGCNMPPTRDALVLERVLAGMREGRSNAEIARQLVEECPAWCGDEREAFRRVGAFAVRYRGHPCRPA